MPIDLSPAEIKPVDVELAKLRLHGGVKTLQKQGSLATSDSISLKKAKIRERLLSNFNDLIGDGQQPALEAKAQARIGKLIALDEIAQPAQVQRVLGRFWHAIKRLESGAQPVRPVDVFLVRDPREQTRHTRGYELAAPENLRAAELAKAFPDDPEVLGRVDALITAAKQRIAEYAQNSQWETLENACILLARAAVQGSREAKGRLEHFAAQGSPLATQGLVFMYMNGRPRNVERAVHYAELGAALHSPAAHHWLGLFYSNGEDIAPNLERAIHHFEQLEATNGANDRLEDMSHSISRLYRLTGPTQNIARANHYLLLAAQRGNVNAAIEVGANLYDKPGSSISTAGWARTLQAAAEQGDLVAECMLGVAHSRGHFTDASDATAVRLLQHVAESGEGAAAFIVGYHYETGRGVTKSVENALRCYRFAAKHNDLDAMRVLSRRYIFGDGVAQDMKKGLKYLKAAADLGDGQAAMLYAGALELENVLNASKAEVLHYYQVAARADVAEAEARLAVLRGDSSSA